MRLNPATGEWESEPGDSDPVPQQAGILGDQAQAPMLPSPVPPQPESGLDTLPIGDLPMAPGQSAPAGMAEPQATPLPPPAPGTPPAIPDLPDVKPVQPLPAPAPIPASRTVTPAESANLGQIDQLNAGRMASAQDQGAIGTAQARAKIEDADRQAAEHEQFLAERQRIADDADKRIKERTAQATADMAKYKAFGIKDPAAEDSFTTRMLKALAIAGGAYASGMNGGSNQALGIIQAAAKDNIDRQKAQQEKLMRIAEESGKDADKAKSERDDAFKQLDIKHAELLDASAIELKKQLLRTGVPQAQVDSNEAVQKLQADALQLREKTLRDIAQDETSLARADIAALAKKKAAGGGGGAAAGGAAEKLAQAIQEGKDGKPLTQAEMIHAANALGVPLEAKAGRVSLKTIAAESTFNADQARKNAASGLAGDRLASKDVKDWAKTNGVDAIAKQQRELSALQKELADNPHNPLQQALAVEKAVSAARGGAASKQALALALGHLGGTLDNADAVISKIRSGEIGPKQMENFKGFISGQLGAAQNEGRKAYDSYNQYMESATDPGAKARLLQERSRLFSGLSGFGGRSEGAPARAAGTPVPSSEKAAALQWAQSHRDDPRAQKILQALGQ